MLTLEFLITSLIVVLVPGTGVVNTVSTGLAQGQRAAIHAALGCTAGILPHLLATVLGLAAFLPQFVDPMAGAPMLQLFGVSAVFMAMTFAVFVVYGFVAHALRRHVIGSPRVQAWLRRGFAAAFAGLGARLAASDR